MARGTALVRTASREQIFSCASASASGRPQLIRLFSLAARAGPLGPLGAAFGVSGALGVLEALRPLRSRPFAAVLGGGAGGVAGGATLAAAMRSFSPLSAAGACAASSAPSFGPRRSWVSLVSWSLLPAFGTSCGHASRVSVGVGRHEVPGVGRSQWVTESALHVQCQSVNRVMLVERAWHRAGGQMKIR
jgi:hypothetical protein